MVSQDLVSLLEIWTFDKLIAITKINSSIFTGSDWVTDYMRKTINDKEGKKPLPVVIE